MHKIRGTLTMHVLIVGKNHIFMSLLFYLPSATSLTGTKFRLDCPCHVVCLTLEYHAQVYTAVFCKPRSYWAACIFTSGIIKNRYFLAGACARREPWCSGTRAQYFQYIYTDSQIHAFYAMFEPCMHAWFKHERESNANERCRACL